MTLSSLLIFSSNFYKLFTLYTLSVISCLFCFSGFFFFFSLKFFLFLYILWVFKLGSVSFCGIFLSCNAVFHEVLSEFSFQIKPQSLSRLNIYILRFLMLFVC